MPSLEPPVSDGPRQSTQPSASEFGGTVCAKDGSLHRICIVEESRQGQPEIMTTHRTDAAGRDLGPSAAWVVREEHDMSSSWHPTFDQKLIAVFGYEHSNGRFLYCRTPKSGSDGGATAKNTGEPFGLWIGLKAGEDGPWTSILRKGTFKSKSVSSGLFEIWTLEPKENLTREELETADSSREHCADKQPTIEHGAGSSQSPAAGAPR